MVELRGVEPLTPCIDAHAGEVGENGHRLVVRNGHLNEREVIAAAPVPVLPLCLHGLSSMPAGDDRGPRGRHQGSHRA
jgi:hypothetical protein